MYSIAFPRPTDVVRGLALAALPVVLLLAPLIAHADEATTVGKADVNWGPNASGWNVTVVYDSGFNLDYPGSLPTDNVYYANQTIAENSTDTGIRGRHSILGGPADMNIHYNADSDADSLVWIDISATSDGVVNATCRGSGYLRCVVVTEQADQPVILHVVNGEA